MDIVIAFDPDPDLGTDHKDHAGTPRRLAQVITSNTDCFVVWREWGEQFEGGSRTHVTGQGIWEHLTPDQIEAALASINSDIEQVD